MAIRMSIEQHHVAFPTKVLSDKVGRVLNMVIKKGKRKLPLHDLKIVKATAPFIFASKNDRAFLQ